MAEVFTLPQRKSPLHRFLYEMHDAADRHISPHALEVEAHSLGHALQKIAAALADDCVDVWVWKAP